MEPSASTKVPSRLDDPWKIAWFEIEVAVPFIVCVTLGLLADQKTIGLIVGAFAARAVGRLKAGRHRGVFVHWSLWHLPPTYGKPIAAPPSPSHDVLT